MISYNTFYFWTFILGCTLIIYVTYNLGRAERKARGIELVEMFNELGIEDIEK